MDCLVWDYTLAIYPSFETSKDCTILHSYILSLDEVSDKNKSILSGEFHSKEGSLNELIRTKKLSSSLTVHRRVKVDTTTSTVPKESPNIFSIMKFDTFVNECNSTKTAKTGKRVSLKIIEGDCSFAQVQLSGDITQIDMTSEKALTSKTRLDDSDGLHALVPFFLPTGKAVVPCKNKNGRIFEVCQPPAKLYSMVLKAKDQTTIYACSLVLYRPVLFLEDSDTTGTCGNDSREAINIDNLLSDKLDDTAGTNAKSLLVEGDTMTSVDNGIEANKESTATSTEYVAKDHLNVLTSTHKAGFSDILTSGFEDMSPSRTNLVCSKRDTSDDSTTFVIPKLTELKFELPTGTQTSPSGAAAGVSELTATTPAVIPLLSSSPRELLSPMERTSPVAFLTAAGIKVKFSTNFSDDESAGLSSSVISHEHVISRSNSAAHIDKKVAIGVMKYPQGAFTEFLSATANATASVASAIVLQAGSLPSSSFAWTESANASKSNEPKGFYDQLPFFRFKSINFTNNSPVHFEIGSQLKRKYEGNAQPEPLTADTEKSLSTELKSLCLTELNLPFSPTSVENSISSQSWNFSSEKPLSSYPRFGAVKSVRRASSSPRSPYRSPSQRNPGHSHNRRFRSQLHGNSRIPYPLNREASDSNSRSEASSTVHSGAAIKKISFDSSSSAQTALLSVSHINSTSITKSVSAERAPPISLSIHSENYTAEREGVAYVAHGFALLTEVPMIGRLRQAASDAASDFANACYPQKSADNGIPYSTLDDHHNFSSMITKCIRSSLKLEENSSLNPNIASSHDSHPDIAAGSNFTFEEKSSDYDSSIVFEALSPKNLVTVLLAFLLEYRIVAVSSEALSASTHLGEWLKDAIYPLKYAHVYSPLVPPCVGLQLIHCPAPFFIGMKRTTKIDEVVESEDEREREKIRGRRGKSAGSKDSSCGLLLVDLDRDECSMPQDLCLLMKSARLLVTALEALLYPKLSCCDQIISQEKESTISVKSYKAMQLCRQFVGSILEGSKRSCLRAVDGDEHIVIFDEILFMQQHFLRLSLHPTTLAMAKVSGKQNITEVEDTIVDAFSTDSMSLLPSSVSGAKDVEKLLRSLIITQCFSLYLTS